MKIVSPEVYHVAQTTLDRHGLGRYFDAIGRDFEATLDFQTDAPSDAEKLIEVLGRGCYRSFAPGLNKNVTKIREGNAAYIKNILDSRHGSVIEHAYDTYVFWNVSRVFTHELVRQRISSFAQESLRYVRLETLKAWWPKAFEEHSQKDALLAEFTASFVEDEQRQVRVAKILSLDELKDFGSKKKLTSAMRRMAPIGLATMIGYTCNHRNYRHVIELRTSRHAEEEIRQVWAQVYMKQRKLYPNLYQDGHAEMVEGELEVTFTNGKI